MGNAVTLPPIELGTQGSRYDSWLRSRPDAGEEYLRSDARVRFEPRDRDVLVAPPGLTALGTPLGCELRGPALPHALGVAGVTVEAARRFIAALDGARTLAEARALASLDGASERALLDAAFGKVLFAPLAVMALERAVSGVELVRFPGAPYEIVRSYWDNMAAVRRRLPALEGLTSHPEAALRELAELHVVALLGEKLDSFYRPASRIAKNGISPGTLWQTPTRTRETPAGTLFLEGPRVHAPLLGGAPYAELLAELTGDPAAALGRRVHADAGLDWGRILTGSAEGDPEPLPWFCPPRPITSQHAAALFTSLGAALGAAASGERAAALEHLADFHQRFVRLHPFRACNQALAMNIVNAVLARVSGSGMPHLLLDHVALRFSPVAYRRLFALAAEGWCVAGAPAARLGELLRKKAEYFALVGQLASAADASAARVAAEMSPAAARLALLALD
jgi:hypothetical protein